MGAFRTGWLCRFALLAVAALGLALPSAPAQTADALRELPTRERSFRIPFRADPGDARLREVQLFVSRDYGQTWTYNATAQPSTQPDANFFPHFTAAQDGHYWFSVRTIDQQGRAYPPTDREFQPGLKVLVDTVPPVVTLRSLAAQGAAVAVDWDVLDDNLDLTKMRLEYRAAGSSSWLPARIDQLSSRGQQTFSPMTNGAIEVRLTAADTAGNIGEGKVTVTPGVGGISSGPSAPPAATPAGDPATTPRPTPPAPQARMVNSTKISLNYRIDDVGPSGVSVVELWFTRDGRSWQKYQEYAKPQPPLVIDVDGEGLYGFTLVVKSGVGTGDKPPQFGDAPQVWVEVDRTAPVVRLLNVEVGKDADAGTLTITWTATDKNFGPQPITLTFAETPEGPWHPIADKVENRGRFVWRMPAPGAPPTGVPFKFLVRVEATDRAGNVSSDQTKAPVAVDLAKPKAAIIDIGPVGK